MITVTANKLKTQGVSSIAKALEESREVIISVRGKPRYAVMTIEDYDRLREGEIEAAWFRARQDVEQGRFTTESADEHIARIQTELNDEL
jgi:prevent-host-death family protein